MDSKNYIKKILILIQFLTPVLLNGKSFSSKEVKKINLSIKKQMDLIEKREYFFSGIRFHKIKRAFPIEKYEVVDKELVFTLIDMDGSYIKKSYDLFSSYVKRSPPGNGDPFSIKLDRNTSLYFRFSFAPKLFTGDLVKLISFQKTKSAILAEAVYLHSSKDKPSILYFPVYRKFMEVKYKLSRSDQDLFNIINCDREKSELQNLISDFKKTTLVPQEFGSNSTSDTEDYFDQVDKYSRHFLSTLAVKPELMIEMKICDLVSVLKRILLDSVVTPDITKLYEGIFNLDNNFMTSYLIQNGITQSDKLMKKFSEDQMNEIEFLEFLRKENDLLFLASSRNDFSDSVDESKDQEEYQYNESLNQLFVSISSLRIFFIFKHFQKSNEFANDFINEILDENKSRANQLIDQDFDPYGRYAQAGSILSAYLKFEKKLIKSENLSNQERYSRLIDRSFDILKNRDNVSFRESLREIGQTIKDKLTLFDVLFNLDPDFGNITHKTYHQSILTAGVE